ncbi:hypothetical protein GRX01_12300 [Halobaculum sp. WSA2]|uniref:Uncharacterized protein n=1 Tax=Halobaculum saliterrae TaxID=2073113 RepID=A0A6B0SU72_9EURY|nr:hypothetical protein [Halobaculum saliterrae]MXR42117.1 hypothetical protein [Halobaculum saliterrae]
MSDADDPDPEDDAPDEEGPVRDVVRVDGPESPDEDAGDDEGPPVGREGVMDPDELDIRGRDGVDETDDGRYVISTGGEDQADPRDDVPGGSRGAGGDRDGVTGDDGAGATDPPEDAGPAPDVTGTDGWADAADSTRAASVASASRDADGDPLDAVVAELDALSASHGFALAVAAGGETDTLRVASGDPTDTLATALRWYARRVNPDEPAEETIAALLASSDLDVR